MPTIERSGATPIYHQLTEWMRGQIASGAWPPGYKLTAEADLADELGFARGTVRKAIEKLTAEGLLVRSHGRGTFVSPPPVDQPLAERLVTHSEALIAQGIAFTTRVLNARLIAAPPAVAAQLGCAPETPLFFLRRIRTVEGAPVTLLHNYVLATHCPGIEEVDLTRYRLFEVLEERYNLILERGRRIFQAVNADEEMAALLDMDAGAAVMHLAQTTYLPHGQAVEYSDVWLRGSSFRLSATMLRGNRPAMDIVVLTQGLSANGAASA